VITTLMDEAATNLATGLLLPIELLVHARRISDAIVSGMRTMG
jgi:hypothetical protein